MMKMTVQRKNLFFFLYTAEFLVPQYFTGSFVSWLNHVFLVLGIVFLFSRMYRPSKYMWAVIAYFTTLTGITFLKQTDRATLTFLMENVRMMVYLGTVDCMFRIDKKSTISMLYKVIGFYVLLDFLSLVFFPDGFTTREINWNQWTTSYEGIWIYGRKNNRIYWYAIVCLLSWWNYNEKRTDKAKLLTWFFLLVMTLATVLEKSSTSIVAAMIVDIALLGSLMRKGGIKKAAIKNILIGYSVVEVLLVFGSVAFLRPVIEDFLQKDLTFSGRTTIWAQMCLLIAAEPITGHGVASGMALGDLLDGVDRTSAHNQWLSFLYQGGIVLFVVAIVLFMTIWRSIKNQDDNRRRFVFTFVLLAILITMLFEAEFNTIKCELFLLLMYCLSNARGKGEHIEQTVQH